MIGFDMGLILLVKGFSNDYFYSIFNSIGFTVSILNPYEFADGPSGGLIERLITLGTETFIRVDPTVVRTEPDARRYSKETRECVFQDEMKGKLFGPYERSNCVINCRMKSMIALCGCVPFYLPELSRLSSTSYITCNLQHIPCLNKYKGRLDTNRSLLLSQI